MDAKHILITGGAGFIGANLVWWLRRHRPHRRITVVDKLGYAGDRRYIEGAIDGEAVSLVVADIADRSAMERLFDRSAFDGVMHLAAESHVDRSIEGPEAFVKSNVEGTFVVLECARRAFGDGGGRMLHVSTDEVYGSLGDEGAFDEQWPYDPSSPYSATKAASDHLARAYHRTYGLDVVISHCTNNFGPYQYPEKLIPLTIDRLLRGEPIPIYGDGQQVRDWLYVDDHCRALVQVFEQGEEGERYNIGARNEWSNRRLVERLADVVDRRLGRTVGVGRELMTFVEDRPGHDRRYAIDPSRVERELGWRPRVPFEEGLERTVEWFMREGRRLWGGPEGGDERRAGL